MIVVTKLLRPSATFILSYTISGSFSLTAWLSGWFWLYCSYSSWSTTDFTLFAFLFLVLTDLTEIGRYILIFFLFIEVMVAYIIVYYFSSTSWSCYFCYFFFDFWFLPSGWSFKLAVVLFFWLVLGIGGASLNFMFSGSINSPGPSFFSFSFFFGLSV